jgi:hypothetical protein
MALFLYCFIGLLLFSKTDIDGWLFSLTRGYWGRRIIIDELLEFQIDFHLQDMKITPFVLEYITLLKLLLLHEIMMGGTGYLCQIDSKEERNHGGKMDNVISTASPV